MDKTRLLLLAATAVLFTPVAVAKSPFDGLEMDVIGAGQLPKGPTARIALPRPPAAAADAIGGTSGYEDSIADSLIGQGAQHGIEATDSAGVETPAAVRDEAGEPAVPTEAPKP